ncbi:MAG: PocR ligand-binding domain-containing protein [Dissulfurispiraceae bacterium]
MQTCRQDICTLFHRTNFLSGKHCQESYKYIKTHPSEGISYRYKCKNGLADLLINNKGAKGDVSVIVCCS